MEESPQQQILRLPLPPIKPTLPQFVNAQVAKDVATWAASEEAKAANDGIKQHILEGSLGEIEAVAYAEWYDKMVNGLGIPRDMLERGREVMAAQMRTMEKAMRIGLEPVLGQMRKDDADRYRQMCTDLAAQIVLQGGKPPQIRWHVNKTNKSRSWLKNLKLGRRAEQLAKRWPTWHRRHKKWMRVAAKCGVIVWGDAAVHLPKPAEYITLNFDILKNGEVTFQ
jgi:hypothetical protein